MARSSLIAGGCDTPTDGNLPTGQGKVNTAILADGSSMRAMWTSDLSPHSPSSVARASISSSIARRQPSVVTVTRGKGRCASAVFPRLTMSARVMGVSSKQSRHSLEPCDELRRKIDARGEHQRKMREHRHVGAFHLQRLALWLAERDAVQLQEQRAYGDQQPEHEGHGEQWMVGQSCADREELRGEQAERRQAGDSRHADDQTPADQGIRFGQPAHLDDLLRALDLRDVADGE